MRVREARQNAAPAAASAVGAVGHRDLANAIRALSMDAVQAANSGHPGMPMGMADVATVLFSRFLKFDPERPDWPDRDRFVLSAGHGSMLLYSLLHLTGYADIGIDEIKRFRQLGSRTPGHPEYGAAPPASRPPPGRSARVSPNAVGMALAESHLAATFGDDLVDHFTYALAGDGCLMEGVSQEAISLAGHLRLRKLVVLFDDNRVSIDGPTSLATSEDMPSRFAALRLGRAVGGWPRRRCGSRLHRRGPRLRSPGAGRLPHDDRLRRAQQAGDRRHPWQPAGRGGGGRGPASSSAGRHRPSRYPRRSFSPGATSARAAAPPPIPGTGACARRGPEARAAFARRIAGTLPDAAAAARSPGSSANSPPPRPRTAPRMATRRASQQVLERLNEIVPELLGGSADLTGSNLTRAGALDRLDAGAHGGRYIHYGVREHAMAAVMNGLALHRGVIPYGGTFLVFSDYLRPALRLSALSRLRVIYVMTHDSIGLGEDGPTHQPIEHLAALRAIPNLLVMRPADAVETAECWALALDSPATPTVLALTRQGVAPVRREHVEDNLCARGASRAGRRRRPGAGHDSGDGIGSRDRACRARCARGRRRRDPGSVDAVPGAVRAPGARLPRGRARGGYRAGWRSRRRRHGAGSGISATTAKRSA